MTMEPRRSGGVTTTATKRNPAAATATTNASARQNPPSRRPSTSINPKRVAATTHPLTGAPALLPVGSEVSLWPCSAFISLLGQRSATGSR